MQKNAHILRKLAGFLFIQIVLTGITNPAPATAQEKKPFLTTLESQPSYDLKAQPDRLGSVRVQPVSLQTAVLDQLQEDLVAQPQSLGIQLFPDLQLDVIFDHQSRSITGTTLLSGTVSNDPQSSIHLAQTDGVISANLVYQHTQYQLRQTNGQYFFTEIDQGQFPQEADPILPEIQAIQADTKSLTPLSDSGAVIDVMVVYTPTARSLEGGTKDIQNLINLAVDETNTGYAASGITHRMRLVHTEEVNYSETGFDWATALTRLQGSSDGSIDHVHALRDAYGADLVVMIVGDKEFCGIGYLLPSNSTAYAAAGFSVVSSDCAVGYYSFGHETGHNLGAHHDRDNANGSGLFPYSYGYQAPDNTFRTVMAYNCAGGCIRINRWSNPDSSYLNQPTGVISTAPNSADNRMTLNNSANTVANFRQTISLPAPSNLTTSSTSAYSISLTFTDNSSDETGFRIERSPDNSTWSTLATLPSNVTTYTDANNLQCNTTYFYRVKAIKEAATSTASNILQTKSGICVAPDAPQPPAVLPALTHVTLRWVDTLGETAYIVQQSPNGSSDWQNKQTLPANATQATISNLTKSTTYYFRVAVRNDYGTNYTPTLTVTTHSQAVYLPLTVR